MIRLIVRILYRLVRATADDVLVIVGARRRGPMGETKWRWQR